MVKFWTLICNQVIEKENKSKCNNIMQEKFCYASDKRINLPIAYIYLLKLKPCMV